MNKEGVLNLIETMIKIKEAKLEVLRESLEFQEKNNYPSAVITTVEIGEVQRDVDRLKKLKDLLNE